MDSKLPRKSQLLKNKESKKKGVQIETGAQPKRRISFSGRKSVREFYAEENPRNWNDSYEVSDPVNASDNTTNSHNGTAHPSTSTHTKENDSALANKIDSTALYLGGLASEVSENILDVTSYRDNDKKLVRTTFGSTLDFDFESMALAERPRFLSEQKTPLIKPARKMGYYQEQKFENLIKSSKGEALNATNFWDTDISLDLSRSQISSTTSSRIGEVLFPPTKCNKLNLRQLNAAIGDGKIVVFPEQHADSHQQEMETQKFRNTSLERVVEENKNAVPIEFEQIRTQFNNFEAADISISSSFISPQKIAENKASLYAGHSTILPDEVYKNDLTLNTHASETIATSPLEHSIPPARDRECTLYAVQDMSLNVTNTEAATDYLPRTLQTNMKQMSDNFSNRFMELEISSQSNMKSVKHRDTIYLNQNIDSTITEAVAATRNHSDNNNKSHLIDSNKSPVEMTPITPVRMRMPRSKGIFSRLLDVGGVGENTSDDSCQLNLKEAGPAKPRDTIYFNQNIIDSETVDAIQNHSDTNNKANSIDSNKSPLEMRIGIHDIKPITPMHLRTPRSKGILSRKLLDVGGVGENTSDSFQLNLKEARAALFSNCGRRIDSTPHRSFIEFVRLEKEFEEEESIMLKDAEEQKCNEENDMEIEMEMQTPEKQEENKVRANILERFGEVQNKTLGDQSMCYAFDNSLMSSPGVKSIANKRCTANLTPNMSIPKRRQTLMFKDCAMDESGVNDDSKTVANLEISSPNTIEHEIETEKSAALINNDYVKNPETPQGAHSTNEDNMTTTMDISQTHHDKTEKLEYTLTEADKIIPSPPAELSKFTSRKSDYMVIDIDQTQYDKAASIEEIRSELGNKNVTQPNDSKRLANKKQDFMLTLDISQTSGDKTRSIEETEFAHNIAAPANQSKSLDAIESGFMPKTLSNSQTSGDKSAFAEEIQTQADNIVPPAHTNQTKNLDFTSEGFMSKTIDINQVIVDKTESVVYIPTQAAKSIDSNTNQSKKLDITIEDLMLKTIDINQKSDDITESVEYISTQAATEMVPHANASKKLNFTHENFMLTTIDLSQTQYDSTECIDDIRPPDYGSPEESNKLPDYTNEHCVVRAATDVSSLGRNNTETIEVSQSPPQQVQQQQPKQIPQQQQQKAQVNPSKTVHIDLDTTVPDMAKSFKLPPLPPFPSLLDRLQKLRNEPNLQSVHEYWRRRSLEKKASFCASHVVKSYKPVAGSEELSDHIKFLQKTIRQLKEIDVNVPIRTDSFFENLIETFSKTFPNWIVDCEMKQKRIIQLSYKKIVSCVIELSYEDKDRLGNNVHLKGLALTKGNVKQEFWKPIDYILDTMLNINLNFKLNPFEMAGHTNDILITEMLKIDDICGRIFKESMALWKIVIQMRAKLIRQSNRTIVQKIVRDVVADNDEHYPFVQKTVFEIEIRNIRDLCFTDIISPPLYAFREDLQFLPSGIEFLRIFLLEPKSYLK